MQADDVVKVLGYDFLKIWMEFVSFQARVLNFCN